MINLRPLIEKRIRDETSGFSEIAGATDLQTLLAGRLSAAGCYVIPEASRPTGEVRYGNNQRIDEQFAVITSVRNVRDPRGTDAADISFGLRNQVHDAVIGFKPHENAGGLIFSGAGLVSFVNGFFIYRDSFSTWYRNEAKPRPTPPPDPDPEPDPEPEPEPDPDPEP